MKRSTAALLLSIDRAAKCRKRMYLWTLTETKVVDYRQAIGRWRKFVSLCASRSRYTKKSVFSGIRVFQLHPRGHGLHVHVLTGQWYAVGVVRKMWSRVGGGRIDVTIIPISCRDYLSGDIVKQRERPAAFRGVRMWQTFGGFRGCLCKDVVITGKYTECFRLAFHSVANLGGTDYAFTREGLIRIANLCWKIYWLSCCCGLNQKMLLEIAMGEKK